MSAYTALDKVVLFHEQNCTFSACVGHEARAELAALRSRVAELEAAQAATVTPAPRDTLNKVWMHVVRLYVPLSYNNSGDVCEVIIGGDDMIGIQDAAEVIKQSLTQAIVTPRKCVTCNPLAPKPQSQASLSEQLRELVQLANANGLYDAADYIRR